MAPPKKYAQYARVTVSLPPKVAALISVCAQDFDENFSAFVAQSITAYCALKASEEGHVSLEEHVELLHRARREEIAREKQLLDLQDEAHAVAIAKSEAKKQKKRAAKRAKFPTPESLARENAYKPEQDLRALAVEYDHDPDAVLQIALGIRRDAEARAELSDRPEPVKREEWVAHDAAYLKRFLGGASESHALKQVERTARSQGFDPFVYVVAVRAAAGAGGQQNLHVTLAEREAS